MSGKSDGEDADLETARHERLVAAFYSELDKVDIGKRMAGDLDVMPVRAPTAYFKTTGGEIVYIEAEGAAEYAEIPRGDARVASERKEADLMADKPAYRVEIDDSKVCSHCGRGGYWDIIGPDDVALGTSYSDQDAAEQIAEELSRAYEAGLKSRKSS